MRYEVVDVEHVFSGRTYRLVLNNGEKVDVRIDGLESGSEDAYELRFHSYVCSEVQKILGRLYFSYGGHYRYVCFGNMVLWIVGYDEFSKAFDARKELTYYGSHICEGISMYVHLRHPAWRFLLSVFGKYYVFPYLEGDKRIFSPGMYITDCLTFVKIGDHETVDQKKLMEGLVRIRHNGNSQTTIEPEWYIDETALRCYLEKNL